jgi:hypothetical protein
MDALDSLLVWEVDNIVLAIGFDVLIKRVVHLDSYRGFMDIATYALGDGLTVCMNDGPLTE